MKRLSARDNHTSNTHDASEITASNIGTKRPLDVNTMSSGVSPLIINIDKSTTANTTYYGWAEPATATSASAWKIFRKVLTGSDSSYTFADSDGEFDNVWDNRASLSYG